MASVPFALAEALSARYTLERELGRGGMATVYLARDLRHDRLVAFKVLHPELAATLGPDRFLREIKFAARLQHPHILTVLDSGETAGQLWFTMPFVEGESLRDRLGREQQLPVEAALRIATDVARALQYAHEHGVIHRDIKPENLLLTMDGSTLVADFGIARALSGDSDRLTETGISVGTPAYMSPEQAAGERTLDARTDVYALGTVLYEMLTGEPPYTGATAQAVIAKRYSGPVPKVRTVRPSVYPALEHAVTRALSLVPADRFASAGEFAQALASPAVSGPSESLTATQVPGRIPTHQAIARRRMRIALLVSLGMVALGGIGGVLWHRSSHGGALAAHATGPKRLAVLPFENLGDSADAYFADGITDAVRGKLAALEGLEVIARTSSVTYSHTTKPLRAVADELGVQYLLTGTVRWAKAKDGTSHVQVSPELVDVREYGAPATRWHQPFNAALTDVFQMQADIAGRVAEALDVALGAGEHRQLARRPTADLAAYDAFLKGEATAQSLAAEDLPTLRLAVSFYQEAVAHDSSFGLAWARLALAHALVYGFGSRNPVDAEAARRALTRAKRLSPETPETYRAQAVYEDFVRRDFEAALATAEAGLKRNPDQSDLIAMAVVDEFRLGHVNAAVDRLTRAQALDPRSFLVARNLGYALTCQRRWSEAHRVLNLAQSLAPTDVSTALTQVRTYVAEGDLSGARRVLDGVQPGVERLQRAAVLAYEDLFWVLDDTTQRRVLTLSSSALDGERSDWALMRAQLYHFRGDADRARVYADTARITFEARLVAAPNDEWLHVLRGLALAYLGRKAEAIQEGTRGIELLPISRDALGGPDIQNQLVLILLLVGEPEQALDRLEPLLKIPYYLSPAWLKIDPTFAPLRGNPRFERLVATN